MSARIWLAHPLLPSTFCGLTAPGFVWLAVVVITLLTLGHLIFLYVRVRQEIQPYQELKRRLDAFREERPPSATEGLSEEAFEALRSAFEAHPKLRSIWNDYSSQLVRDRDLDGRDVYWSDGGARKIFSDGGVSRINWRWLSAFPGFITGVGLLVTFSAILFALMDLHQDASGQIKGIDQLLDGLSGKFISSVAALLSASLYLPFERIRLHKFEQSRQNLSEALDSFVPRLTPARILMSLKRDTAEQADALRAMLTDVGPKLRQGVSEAIGPTLQRMVGAIEDLNQLTRAAEAQRQEALTSALHATLDQLSQDLRQTLGQLGEGFSQSLVGEAGRSFATVLKSLEATGQLVERMNAQFEENQRGMGTLIELARNSARDQFDLGRNQIAELSGTLGHLMERLNQATGTSVTQMSTALTEAIRQMTMTTRESEERIAGLVANLVAQFESSNSNVLSRTNEDLNRITGEVVGKIERFVETIGQAVGRNEQATYNSVKKVLDETSAAVAQMNSALAEMAQQTNAAGQETQSQLAEIVTKLVGHVDESNGAILNRTNEGLNRVTDQVIGKIDQFVETIGQAIGRNEQATYASVRKILDETNELSRQNAERIGAVLERNQQQLERSDVVGRQLNQLAEQLGRALPQYSSVANALQTVAGETNAAALRSKEAAASVHATMEELLKVQHQVSEVAKHSAEQVMAITAASARTRQTMDDYARVFDQVKTSAADLLMLVEDRLKQQVAVSKDGYEAMSKAANESFANAAQRLGGAVENLTDSLDALDEAIGRLRNTSNGRRVG